MESTIVTPLSAVHATKIDTAATTTALGDWQQAGQLAVQQPREADGAGVSSAGMLTAIAEGLAECGAEAWVQETYATTFADPPGECSVAAWSFAASAPSLPHPAATQPGALQPAYQVVLALANANSAVGSSVRAAQFNAPFNSNYDITFEL
mmetsp:Transcript_38723/g.90924  ORF Transcript_38723/g.90924 Transcript_38723/m.90924 type:complete len:151 (+) Transcript_38723:106-558(+)